MRRSSTRALVAGLAAVSVVLAGVTLAGPASAAATAKHTRTSLAAARPTVGRAVTLTATVSPKPTRGTVRFTASGKTLASCGARAVSHSTGRATCRTTFRTAGRRTVAAHYSGAKKRYKTSSASRAVTAVKAVTKPVAKPVAVGTVVGPVGSCTTTKGALVAVNLGPWKGPLVRGCGTTLTTGRALLTSGGFTLTNVQRFPGFVCRIGNPLFASGARYPTTAQDACVNTPPSTAYWSFWTAAKGVNTWTYSAKGADADVPVNGEVEVWTYGATDVNGSTGTPSVTPNQLRAGLPTGAAAVPAARRAVRALAASPTTPDVDAAVAYLTKNLVGGDHFEAFPGTADIGLTIDGAYALAAASENATLAKVVAYVAAHENDYTTLTGPYAAYAGGGYVGKVALLAEMAGRDPRAFGGADLIAGIDRLICTKADATRCAAAGNYVYTSSTFGQALGILAQLRAGDTTGAKKPVAYLETQQRSSGGFPSIAGAGNGTGAAAETDSTAMAAMALSLVDTSAARTAVTKALTWLAKQQAANGGFPGAAGDSVNSAAVAIQALRLDAETYGARIARAEKFLASAQNTDGGFDVASGVEGSDVRASAQALGGAIGVPFGSVLDSLSAQDAASAGADFLVKQLVGGDHYTGSYVDGQGATQTFDDQGLTADGVFALVGTGGHAADVAKMVTYLQGQVDAYADPTGAFGGPYSGALAKLALVAESTGGDPHAFGGTDLLGLLSKNICTAANGGSCTAAGDFANAFSGVSQALGVLALQASPTAADHLTAASSPVVRLHQLQCADGGFSSTLIAADAICTSDVDTTGYAVQALAAVPGTDLWLGKAQTYLQGVQKNSGLFPGASGVNSNSTALAAQALQTLVTALYSPTIDPPGPKLTTPIVAWQSALRGLVSVVVSTGGFGLTSSATADLRASTQAVAAAAQHSLFAVSGATLASTPRGPFTATGGAPTSGSGHAPAGSGTPVSASGGLANTGVPTRTLLWWAALLLLLGAVVTVTGRRRVAAVVGRHRDARGH